MAHQPYVHPLAAVWLENILLEKKDNRKRITGYFFHAPAIAEIPDSLFTVNKVNSCFTVKSVKKKKNNVYVIYALKNDSIYKIVSYYDGNKGDRKKKLARGMQFQATLISQFGNIISPCNLMLDFHGVAIGLEYKKRHILDLWLCEELNGPYLTK